MTQPGESDTCKGRVQTEGGEFPCTLPAGHLGAHSFQTSPEVREWLEEWVAGGNPPPMSDLDKSDNERNQR